MSTRPRDPSATPLDVVAGWLADAGHDVRLVPVAGAQAETPAVTGFSLSSQRIAPGDLYAALPGARVHGIAFADAARDAGAVAVLTDESGVSAAGPDHGLPILVVDRPRALLGLLAARLYGDPAARMRMVGITGTQGKTTTSRLAEAGLQTSGTVAAVIGTVGTRIAGEDVRTSLTTPEAPDLHGLFAVMVERGVEVCLMEVSSHALVLGRVDGVVFDVAVFLNLGRDHLDFHTDVEDYYRAKASLFTPERARLALVNLDDEHGRRLAGEAAQDGVQVRTFSLHDSAADWWAGDLDLQREGSTFTVHGPGGVSVPAGVSLPGDFNVANALAAIAATVEAGCDAATVAEGILTSGGVPGRLERVEAGQDFLLVVDYAHKPDAVDAAIRTLRPLAGSASADRPSDGRVIVVLGAGGDRDPGKRPIMAGIAARLADLLIVTDDNPRTEEPALIRAAMLAGTRDVRGQVVEIGDRAAAIAHAVDVARPGDVVLVAGKGHETGQEIDGVVHDFDDRVVAREALLHRGRRR